MKFSELVVYFERLEATTKRLEMFDILAGLFKHSGPKDIDKIIYMSQGQLLPAFHGLETGMSEKLLIRALSQTTGKDSGDITEEFKKSGDLGLTAEQIIKKKGDGLSVSDVYNELLKLPHITGEGSVEKKISILSNLFSASSKTEAKYIARFVIGRLRLGVGDQTVLEALALSIGDRSHKSDLERAYNLCSDLGLVGKILLEKGIEGIRKAKVQIGYPIRMALCERLPSAEKIVEKIGRCAIESKYDGFRCQVHKTKSGVEIFSRNLERTTPMFPEIVEGAKRHIKAMECIFEGEALAYNDATGELFPFQVTIQRKRKHGVEEMAKEFPLKFFVFDLLYADGVDYTEYPYQKRRLKMYEIIERNTVMEPSETIITDDPEAITKFFEDTVSRGLEGIIAKRLDAPYSAGARNFNWIKLKRSYKGELADTIDVCIVGYFAGKGQRAKFGVGALLGAVYDPDSDSFKTVSKVGSGFSDEEWTKLKEMLNETAIGHKPARVDSLIEPDVWVTPTYVVTVTADEITRSPTHTAGREDEEGYALRFPRAQGFIREDKNPEDATTVAEIIEMFEMQKSMKV